MCFSAGRNHPKFVPSDKVVRQALPILGWTVVGVGFVVYNIYIPSTSLGLKWSYTEVYMPPMTSDLSSLRFETFYHSRPTTLTC